MPIDYLNFISYASYRTSYIDIYLENGQFFLPKIKIPLALGIKNWEIQLKKAWKGLRNEKVWRKWKVKEH